MANKIEIVVPSVTVMAMSAEPFEAVRVYDEAAKHYTDEQAKNASGVPLWRARGQVIMLGKTGAQGNVEIASVSIPRVEQLKPFAVKNATVSIWTDRRQGGLGVKVSAEVGE